MITASLASLMKALREYPLLGPAQLEEVTRRAEFTPTAKALARELIDRAWLTPYQANQLLQGKGKELVLGSYLLLERLGEGGMGVVFKARHRTLGRVAAVKQIRKDRLTSVDAAARFEREVRAAAMLSHPNIVVAYDADRIDGSLVLVMEYVEGAIDLARLVEKYGPLPLAQACDFIRQAALGLQHAHERGMVHRDIKPHNLLLSADHKTVKILDMGLARLDEISSDNSAANAMTLEGAVLGTPDYIAPEQARESHTVDIRADLYALGCTFFHLLTGQPPFPTGSLLEKLDKHQNEEPPDVQALRPKVPARVAGIVRRLMAKKPADRYRTPANLVEALAALGAAEGHDATMSAFTVETLPSPMMDMVPSAASEGSASARRAEHRLGLIVSVVALAFVVCAVALFFLSGQKASPRRLGEEADKEDAPVPHPPGKGGRADAAWLAQTADLPAEKQVDAVIAKLREINPGFNGRLKYQAGHRGVTELRILGDNITDISPLRALKTLTVLDCSASARGRSGLADLSPLRGLALTALNCERTEVSDLAPLKDMPLASLICSGTRVSSLTPLHGLRLTYLRCDNTDVSDLSPLAGMPLKYVGCWGTKVASLKALKGMALTGLSCQDTAVSDLSPLKDMPLIELNCLATMVSSLAPLKGMPLKDLRCDVCFTRDVDLLGSLKALETINGRGVKEFWEEMPTAMPP